MRVACPACAFALVALLLAGDPLGAQSPLSPQVPATTRTVNLTAEQRYIIRELVRDLAIKQAPDDTKVVPGAVVPETVELHPVPALLAQKVPHIRSHRLFLTRDRIVLVEPQDRIVVEVIE
ncbi:MAG: DUF1236 domain-containing protein [Hyphomicrobiales bacterium]|nr:DUF1236 domain-containing protein [Hyphomicrobiales bacterium]